MALLAHIVFPTVRYSALYEKDHFNQAQAEFKKELNGQSKPVAQKKKKGKKEGVYHALREWLGTHTPKDGPFASQHFPSFTIRCNDFGSTVVLPFRG